MSADLLSVGGLSLDRLQSFCLVAEARGVTKAAKGDPAKQSLFSRQVKELEEYFGTQLIKRKGRGVALTEAGSRLHVVARECLVSLLDFKNQCKNLPPEVAIGAGESVIEWLLLPCLAEILECVPRARFKFLNLQTEEAVKRLGDGSIDFAVVRSDAVSRPLRSAPLGIMNYSLFIPKELQLARRKTAQVKLLDDLPLATLEGEGSFRGALADIAKRLSIRLNIQLECASFPLVARAVQKGHVAAVLPTIAASELQESQVCKVQLGFLGGFDRKMCLASNPRSLRIRPTLGVIERRLSQLCRFDRDRPHSPKPDPSAKPN